MSRDDYVNAPRMGKTAPPPKSERARHQEAARRLLADWETATVEQRATWDNAFKVSFGCSLSALIEESRKPRRYRAFLSMRNGSQFRRDFDDLDAAKQLCARVHDRDLDSSQACENKERFAWFAIEDTHTGLSYLVEDWDEYFGLQWSLPTARP